MRDLYYGILVRVHIGYLTIFICFRTCSINQSLEQHGQKQIPSDFLYEYKLGKTAAGTGKYINEAFGKGSVSVCKVQRWFQRFRQGDETKGLMTLNIQEGIDPSMMTISRKLWRQNLEHQS